jgi:hypothetical protein
MANVAKPHDATPGRDEHPSDARRVSLATAAIAATVACAVPTTAPAADLPAITTDAGMTATGTTSAARMWRWRVVCRNGHCRRVRVLSRS